MSAIRGTDTKPEMVLRRALHARGFRFRVHRRDLPGSPDLVFPGRRAVIFVHGCFWHRHAGCRFSTTPATRTEFWQRKFTANVARDERNRLDLAKLGWRVATVWECQLKRDALEATVDLLASWLNRTEQSF